MIFSANFTNAWRALPTEAHEAFYTELQEIASLLNSDNPSDFAFTYRDFNAHLDNILGQKTPSCNDMLQQLSPAMRAKVEAYIDERVAQEVAKRLNKPKSNNR